MGLRCRWRGCLRGVLCLAVTDPRMAVIVGLSLSKLSTHCRLREMLADERRLTYAFPEMQPRAGVVGGLITKIIKITKIREARRGQNLPDFTGRSRESFRRNTTSDELGYYEG